MKASLSFMPALPLTRAQEVALRAKAWRDSKKSGNAGDYYSTVKATLGNGREKVLHGGRPGSRKGPVKCGGVVDQPSMKMRKTK